MTYEDAVQRLMRLASENDGVLTAETVEADEELANERDLVSAAAHALAGGTNVFSSDYPDDREWFPYSSLLFSAMASPAARRTA